MPLREQRNDTVVRPQGLSIVIGDITFVVAVYRRFRIGSVSTSGFDTTWPRTDLGEVVRSNGSKNFNCIDPNVIDDGTGLKFTFGSYWDGIFQSPLSGVKTPSAVSRCCRRESHLRRNPTGHS